jgi:hypothetical protein
LSDWGNALLMDNGDRILLENGAGILLLDSAPPPIAINNYLFVRAGDGVSVAEKIR